MKKKGKVYTSKYKQTVSYPPIDFSFRSIENFIDFQKQIPRSGKRKALSSSNNKPRKKTPQTSLTNISTNSTIWDENKSKVREKIKNNDKSNNVVKYSKYLGESIKLSNNYFSNLNGFSDAMKTMLETPTNLKLIDLSFNRLSMLEDFEKCLGELKNLKVLYLHGNMFENVNDVYYLKVFKDLRVLSLHGNPLDQEKNYRFHILYNLPTLKSLDFTTVTKKDRETVKTYEMIYRKKIEIIEKKIKRKRKRKKKKVSI